MQTLLLIAFALFAGLLMTRFFDRFHLIGPSLTKMALTKAGDIQAIPAEVANRRKKSLEKNTKPVPPAFNK